MVAFSILDLSPIRSGGSAGEAFANSLHLARQGERWGYTRFWLAEHHNMPAIASAATAVLIAHIAAGTSTIRVGAGGVMLPNHAPLVIAEQFGTLETLFPGRIDLGVGRAPGADQATARALRRHLDGDVERFPDDVVELIKYFEPAHADQRVRAVPGAGLKIPIWILGSSTFGARLAAYLGLPFAFASHFAPEMMMAAITYYRQEFRESVWLKAPYLMLGLNVLAAGSDEEARFLSTSAKRAYLNRLRGLPSQLEPPTPDFEATVSDAERAALSARVTCSAIGARESVRREIAQFLALTNADELMIVTSAWDHAARVRSYEITAHALL